MHRSGNVVVHIAVKRREGRSVVKEEGGNGELWTGILRPRLPLVDYSRSTAKRFAKYCDAVEIGIEPITSDNLLNYCTE